MLTKAKAVPGGYIEIKRKNKRNRLRATGHSAMYILLFIITILAGPLFSDDASINIGIIGGLSMAGINGTEMDAIKLQYDNMPVPRWFGAGGVRIGYPIFRFLELESGLHLSGNGFEVFLDGVTTDIDFSYNLPRITEYNVYFKRRIIFLDIPLSLRLQTKFSSKRHFRFYTFAGLVTGFVVSAVDQLIGETATGTIVDESYSTKRETLEEINLLKDREIVDDSGNVIHYTYDDFFRRTNLSWQVGLGFEKRIRSISIFFQYQIFQGLLNFNKVSDRARSELSAQSNGAAPESENFQETTAYFRGVKVSLGITVFIPKQNKPESGIDEMLYNRYQNRNL
jgi:hypothetical protein